MDSSRTTPKTPKVVDKPPTFKDAKGKSWSIKLSLGMINRIQSATDVDLIPPDFDFSPVVRLGYEDDRKLGEALWVCCREQAEEAGIDQDAFFDRMEGEPLSAGWEALRDSIVFFIQSKSPERAKAVHAAFEHALLTHEVAATELVGMIESKETTDLVKLKIAEFRRTVQSELASTPDVDAGR